MIQTAAPALDQMRFIDTVDVYKGDYLAGTLKRNETGEVEFSYLDSYDGEAISFSLPLGEKAVRPGGALPPFFAGLLPEGHRLTVLNRATKTSLDDELTMLLAVGADTPGDVRLFPSGVAPTEPAPLVGELAESDFRVITDTVDRYAVPGVQAKASASMINMPISTEGRYAILKINPPVHPHLVQNEYLHLKSARALKIPVAQAELLTDSKGCEGLFVTRFDRVAGKDGKLMRLAQEDATQVLEILPAQKYSVASEDVVRALAERTQAPKIATRTLYLQFLFAWLTGNGDLHAKNLSILRNLKGIWSVAPMYDLACTALYRDFTMALPVAGRTNKLSGRHWDEFADNIGLPIRAARDIQRLALSTAKSIDLSQLPFEGSPLSGAQKELSSRRFKIESLLQ
ncbi:type II toxin-antitoxin system HipA family toxin [Boudabousia marimammalium]|uniref:HipA-like protein n=1 Tax=Boudabousia marimammalium TaxID=156892 RepID=A0A1Q5PRS0_9ACTO|nr:HipA domain-containing protein [Boudabousia marimammalium]OKL50256.1 HipA-like protein [Boudabousia marimammalium]